ncbi:spermidine/putrescine ABC transporter permease PotC [Vibrio salinus]|uniref:spermidine/putrescine ABC transporter permease PotC n=1 Tax=Vibrio salinus TaxID=2899784 RepID=UPI001E65381D|nr:spermidine/putrescine ABC transporter permease PotC [Vibrio salinus]MCE0492529.1 spermidine/putrescine ABC transporter permease PotC [Vibrio salinus]
MGKSARISFIGVIYAFLYLPIIVLIVNSFNENKFGMKWGGFSTKWYDSLWHNAGLMQAAWHSMTIAFFSASAAALIGSLTAVALFRYSFKGKKLINSMLFIVMMSPDIVMGISLLALFLFIGLHLGFLTLFVAHITFCLPFVVITVYSRLNGFDVKMLEAAKDLGAKEWVILKQIIFPLAKPAIASGWLLSFTLSLDDVIISSFVTGPTYEILPLKIYSMVKVGISPEVNALATIMLILSLILVVISQLLGRDKTK